MKPDVSLAAAWSSAAAATLSAAATLFDGGDVDAGAAKLIDATESIIRAMNAVAPDELEQRRRARA